MGNERRKGQDERGDIQREHVEGHVSAHIVAHTDFPNSGKSKDWVWLGFPKGFHLIPAGKEERMPDARTVFEQLDAALWALQLG